MNEQPSLNPEDNPSIDLAECELGIALWNAKIKEARLNDDYRQIYRLLKDIAFKISVNKIPENWKAKFDAWQLLGNNPLDFLLHAYIAYTPNKKHNKEKESPHNLKLVMIDMLTDTKQLLYERTNSILVSRPGQSVPLGCPESKVKAQNATGNDLDARTADERICDWQKNGKNWTKKNIGFKPVDLFFRGFSVPYADLADLSNEGSKHLHGFIGLRQRDIDVAVNPKFTELIFTTLSNQKVSDENNHISANAENASLPIPPFKPGDEFSLYEISGGYVTSPTT